MRHVSGIVDLSTIARKGFSPTKVAEEHAAKIRMKLGLKSKASVARLAIGRSLGERNEPPSIPDNAVLGRLIKGDTLFAGDIALWVGLVIEHAAGFGHSSGLSEKEIVAHVQMHWRRGVELLMQDYKRAEGDRRKFLTALAELAALPTERQDRTQDLVHRGTARAGELKLQLGEIAAIVGSGERAEWVLNRTGGSPHMGIFGTTGTGKTRTAKAIFAQLKKAGLPMLIIDPKGDLGGDLAAELGARVIALGDEPIPMDILSTKTSKVLPVLDGLEASIKGAIPALGPKQTDRLRRVAKRLIEGGGRVSLGELADAVDREYRREGKEEDSLTAALHKVREYNLFRPELDAGEFLKGNWIISVNAVADEVVRFALLFLLDYLVRHMKSLPDTPIMNDTQGMRLCLAIDEARRVVEVAASSLMEGLVLECRSKGLSCMFMSQSPAHLDRATDDIIEQIQAILSFKSSVKKKQVERMFGSRARPHQVEELALGHYLGKWPGHPEPVVVKAWEP